MNHLGAGDPCPMCGATSGVAPDHDGYACLVCGAPRVLVSTPIERPRREKALLESAKGNRLRRAAWGVVGSLALALAGAVLAIGAVASLVFDFGATTHAVFGSLVLTPLIFSVVGFSKSRSAGRKARGDLDAAQRVVAKELVSARAGVDANELATLLRVPLSRAEELVAEAQVDRMLEEGDRLRVEETATDAEAESADQATRKQSD